MFCKRVLKHTLRILHLRAFNDFKIFYLVIDQMTNYFCQQYFKK